jgi:hypothetical protein
MNKSNRYASFLVRLWLQHSTSDDSIYFWQGEVEHIQTGAVHAFVQLNKLPSLLGQIASEGRSQTSEENRNE